MSDNWSTQLEKELSESNLELTHESVMYVLKKLDKYPKKADMFFKWVTEKNGFVPSYTMYGLMLRFYASKDLIKQFWFTLSKMKELGFFLDEEIYQTVLRIFKGLKMGQDATALTQFYNELVKENVVHDVVKVVVEVVKRMDWGHEVEEKLREMNISVTDDFVLRVLKELKQSPLKALRFFKWVGEGSPLEHNSVTYNGLLRILVHGDSVEEFWTMVKEMKSAGHEIDIDTYIKMSRRFQKIKMFKDAVELYELMMDGPYKPSVQDCSSLLRAIAGDRNPDLDLVFKVVNKYEAAGNSLSKTVYDGIHRSLTSVGRFDEAEKIMEAMKNAGYEPDNITYSQWIYGLCKAKRLEGACQVLEVMKENGCIPDLKTWTILIEGHCKENEVDKGFFWFAKMMENCDPDADLLDVIINGFIGQKRIDGAYKLLTEMVNKARLRPWQATYKNLIQKLLGERKLEEALDLLRLMRKHNHPPFLEPFVQYISKFGTVDHALEFLKALSFKEYPSVSSYRNIFQSFFQEGRHSEAKDLLFKCPLHIRKHKGICSLFGSADSSNTSA